MGMGMSGDGGGDDWIDDKALDAARMESQVFGRATSGSGGDGGPNGEGETHRQTLRRLFEENSAAAAMQIIHLSTSAGGERIRFDASKYIVERVLGPMVTSTGGANGDEHEPGSLEHALAQMEKNMRGEDNSK